MAVAAPLAISTPDSSVTSLRVGGGKGSYGYITRGCNGELLTADKIDLESAGADLSHKFTGPFRIGMRAGVIHPPDGFANVHYVNPYISEERKIGSASIGLVVSDRRLPDGGSDDYADVTAGTFSGHLRLGRKIYWSASYLEDVPITTGGYVQTGIGVTGGRFHVWGGAGILPHDEVGFVSKADVRVWRGFSIGAIARVGQSEGITENGFSLSLSHAWVHRRQETGEPAAGQRTGE